MKTIEQLPKTEPNPSTLTHLNQKPIIYSEGNLLSPVKLSNVSFSETQRNLTIIHFDDEPSENQKNHSVSRGEYPPLTSIINERPDNNDLDESSKREWLDLRKKTVNFAIVEEKINATAFKNLLKLQRCSQESEIMKYIILKKKPIWMKMIFFLKKFIIYHIFSTLISLLFMGVQKQYGQYCFMSPNCICRDRIFVKIFTAFKEYFTYWILY